MDRLLHAENQERSNVSNSRKTDRPDILIGGEENYKRVTGMNISKNSKFFFSYAKKFSKVKTDIGPVLKNNDKYVSVQKIWQISSLNNTLLYIKHPRNAVPAQNTKDSVFNEDNIIAAIDELKTNSSAGPDGFRVLLKNCKFGLAKPLYLFWKKRYDDRKSMLSLKKLSPQFTKEESNLTSKLQWTPQIIFELIEPVGSVETVEPIKLIKQLNQMIHGNY